MYQICQRSLMGIVSCISVIFILVRTTAGVGGLPQRDVDSINAQHADLICFTGDLQNVQPSELKPYIKLMQRLKAKDGVLSVLGNHDYTWYLNIDEDDKAEMEKIRG